MLENIKIENFCGFTDYESKLGQINVVSGDRKTSLLRAITLGAMGDDIIQSGYVPSTEIRKSYDRSVINVLYDNQEHTCELYRKNNYVLYNASYSFGWSVNAYGEYRHTDGILGNYRKTSYGKVITLFDDSADITDPDTLNDISNTRSKRIFFNLLGKALSFCDITVESSTSCLQIDRFLYDYGTGEMTFYMLPSRIKRLISWVADFIMCYINDENENRLLLIDDADFVTIMDVINNIREIVPNTQVVLSTKNVDLYHNKNVDVFLSC